MQIWWNENRYSHCLVARRGHDLFETPKIGILVNKTTYLFTSIREQYFQGVCESFENSGGQGGKFWGLILENPEGREGHTANPFHGGGMDIFWNQIMIT